MDLNVTSADILFVSSIFTRNKSVGKKVWETAPEAWRHTPSFVYSYVMMLYSEKRFGEGNKMLAEEKLDQNMYSEQSLNWKLLKGYELAGCYSDCVELAKEMCEKVQSDMPILHSLSIDAIIASFCKLHNYKKVMEYYSLAQTNHVKVELSTVDTIIRLWVKSDLWKTAYDNMKERAREECIELSREEYLICVLIDVSDLFLQWKARSLFYRQAGVFFSYRLVLQNARFFVPDGNEIRRNRNHD